MPKTNREFFLKIINDEAKLFRKAIEALPEEKHSHKVHDRSRAAGNLAAQLALQWKAIAGVVKSGSPEFDPHEMEMKTKEEMLSKFDEGMEKMREAVSDISDEEWENTDAAMGDMWKDKKGNMAWGFLFDAIHHRGQLTTYLRAMGEKVPSIYGPSADEQ